jgi:hypothetical protein
MDIDDTPSSTNTTNGFTHHETTSQSANGHSLLHDDSNNLVIDHSTNSNGHATKTIDLLDGMEHDGFSEATAAIDVETTRKKSTSSDDDQLLIRILQFGRELHALKQQLIAEHGENQQNDKMLQVN